MAVKNAATKTFQGRAERRRGITQVVEKKIAIIRI